MREKIKEENSWEKKKRVVMRYATLRVTRDKTERLGTGGLAAVDGARFLGKGAGSNALKYLFVLSKSPLLHVSVATKLAGRAWCCGCREDERDIVAG
jgi:hypothetical protein